MNDANPAKTPSIRTSRSEWGVVAVAALLLGWHARRYDFVCDDAYISLVYARNLAEHGELVFNLGERVEGFTNLLWTLLLAGGIRLGFAPENVARWLGWVCGAGVLAVMPSLTRAIADGTRTRLDTIGAPMLALSAGFAAWTSGGLETQLYGLLLSLGVLTWLRGRLGAAGVILGVAAMARPEALLVATLLGSGHYALVVWHQRGLRFDRDTIAFGLGLIAVVAPVFLWRFSYYGLPFPNTYYVKTRVAANPEIATAVLAQGLHYVGLWLWQSGTLLMAPLLVLAAWRRPHRAAVGLMLLAVHAAWVVRVGGDFLGLHRFFVPWMPLVVATAVVGLRHLNTLAARQSVVMRGAALFLAIGLFVSWQMAETATALSAGAQRGIESPNHTRGMAIERARMGMALAPFMHPDDYSVFDAAGAQPFYGRIRGVDRYGLLWAAVAHEDPVTGARPGHQVMAPFERIVRLRPTFLMFCARIHRPGRHPPLCPDEARYLAAGYERVGVPFQTLAGFPRVYAFLKRTDRAWTGLRP